MLEMCKINSRVAILYSKLLSLRKFFTFDGSVIFYKIKSINNLNENVHIVSIIISTL